MSERSQELPPFYSGVKPVGLTIGGKNKTMNEKDLEVKYLVLKVEKIRKNLRTNERLQFWKLVRKIMLGKEGI